MHIIMSIRDTVNSHGIVKFGNPWAQPLSGMWDPFCTVLC